MTCEEVMKQIGHNNDNNINRNVAQFPSMTPTDKKPDETLANMWILLAQLEEINTQFALLLDTLTIPKPTTTLSNPSGTHSNQSGAPT